MHSVHILSNILKAERNGNDALVTALKTQFTRALSLHVEWLRMLTGSSRKWLAGSASETRDGAMAPQEFAPACKESSLCESLCESQSESRQRVCERWQCYECGS